MHGWHVCFPFCTHLGNTEEAATFLTNQLINTLSPVTSGNITIKTESWNSREGVTNASQKSQSWGGSRTLFFIFFFYLYRFSKNGSGWLFLHCFLWLLPVWIRLCHVMLRFDQIDDKNVDRLLALIYRDTIVHALPKCKLCILLSGQVNLRIG